MRGEPWLPNYIVSLIWDMHDNLKYTDDRIAAELDITVREVVWALGRW